MIFTVLGTQNFQFNRLLEELDHICEKPGFTEEVFAQTGHSDYKPQNYSYKEFLNNTEFEQCIANCDLLITHGGVATIVQGMEKNKPIIACPRLAVYKEHVDNHQLQILESFAKMNYILVCKDMVDLYDLIIDSKTHEFKKFVSNRALMEKTLGNYLVSLSKNNLK